MASFQTMLVSIFTPVSAQIVARRSFLGLPPLIAPPSNVQGVIGALIFGQEWLEQEHSPPRIVIVPKGAQYRPIRKPGNQPVSGQYADIEPKAREMRWLLFEAHLWGDPDPTGANEMNDFDACVELEAELLTALYDNCGGTPQVLHGDLEFVQPTDDARLGRLAILRFAVGTNVSDLPNIILPFATATASGLTVTTTIESTFFDGTSSVAGVIVAPPP